MSYTKCTPHLTKRFAEVLKAGGFKKTACQICHITYDTYINWMKKGEFEEEGIYHDFYEAVQEAEGLCELELVNAWHDKVHDDWRAAQGMLERRYKERWSPKVEVDQSVEVSESGRPFNELLELLGFTPVGDIEQRRAGEIASGDAAPKEITEGTE